MASHRQNWFEGWRLFAVLTLVLIALCIWIASMRQFEVEGVRMVVRFTARTSLMFFCLAFSAAALARPWPNGWTRWQRRNRRYLGVTFAASHGLHAIAIVLFAEMAPADFAAATSAASYIFGSIGYGFIILMVATSFDRTASMIGPRAWRILHLTGGLVRQAHPRHAALRGVSDPAVGCDGAAADRDGLRAHAADRGGAIAATITSCRASSRDAWR
jgi:sulfoxide reductase heme-binding subunit YedZ